MKIKNANYYQKKHKDLNSEITQLESEVLNILIKMCSTYPDAPVAKTFDGTIIKAGGINKAFIYRLPFKILITYMQEIEKHIQANLPKQLEIPFNQ